MDDPRNSISQIEAMFPSFFEPAMDQSWDLVEEVTQRRESMRGKKKVILSWDLPGCQLLFASCLEYTTCSLKLNWENFPSWASTYCHMLLPKPYIRPELLAWATAVGTFFLRTLRSKDPCLLHACPTKPAVAMDSFGCQLFLLTALWLSKSPVPVVWPACLSGPSEHFLASLFPLIPQAVNKFNCSGSTHFLVH